MAKLTRKQLKKDRFVEEVGEAVGFFTTHRNSIIAAAVAVVLLVVGGIGFYRYRVDQNEQARLAFQAAMDNYYGEVSLNNMPGRITFATSIEKEMKTEESLKTVAEQYSGRFEGQNARLHLALYELRDGDPDEGQKMLEAVIDGSGAEVSGMARKALADHLQLVGKNEEAIKHYQYLVDHPTEMLPKARVELFGLYDALMATDEQKALELVKGVEERGGAGREMASRLRMTLEARLGTSTPTPPIPPQS
ncbi:MAG: tetratricopeptide repeat protein [Acidobacteria bacterium]|nr:tetratricopeptide repeat protein [Acidobacteriota bacterium]